MFSFRQYCSNVAGGFEPTAKMTTPRLENFSNSSRKRANCARQYGHMKPRRNASKTILHSRKLESRMRFPFTSSSSKSGASSPGVISLLLIEIFFPIQSILSLSPKPHRTFSRSIFQLACSAGWGDMNTKPKHPTPI